MMNKMKMRKKRHLNNKKMMRKIIKMSQKRKKITKKQLLKSQLKLQQSHQKNHHLKIQNLQLLRHQQKQNKLKNQPNKHLMTKKTKMIRKKTSFQGKFIYNFSQKYPTPDEEDGPRAFYTSLLSQNPKS